MKRLCELQIFDKRRNLIITVKYKLYIHNIRFLDLYLTYYKQSLYHNQKEGGEDRDTVEVCKVISSKK